MATTTFVQLSADECTYLLSLIEEMDSESKYTEKQRGYTIPKLQRIIKDPRSARLAYQDVDYLLELCEDDELYEFEQIRGMAQQTLAEIQSLQNARFNETKDIERQRNARKARRNPVGSLQSHFGRTQAELN